MICRPCTPPRSAHDLIQRVQLATQTQKPHKCDAPTFQGLRNRSLATDDSAFLTLLSALPAMAPGGQQPGCRGAISAFPDEFVPRQQQATEERR